MRYFNYDDYDRAMETGADDGRDQYEPDPKCENCDEYDCECKKCDSCWEPHYQDDLDAEGNCSKFCPTCLACDCGTDCTYCNGCEAKKGN